MKTIAEMKQMLRDHGIKKEFKPYLDPNTDAEHILLETHRPTKIVGQDLEGTEIFWTEDIFKIWTSNKTRAKAFALKYKLKLILYEGNEAEVWIPVKLADEILPKFGARIKRRVDPVLAAQAAERFRQFRENKQKTGF